MTIKTRIGLTLSRNHEPMAIVTNLVQENTEALCQIGHWQGAVSRAVDLDPIFQYSGECVHMSPRPIQHYHGSAGNGTGAISRFSGKPGQERMLETAIGHPVYVHPVQSLDSEGNSGSPTAISLKALSSLPTGT